MAEPAPDLSICIPSYNRSGHLADLLDSLSSALQPSPPGGATIEVVVVLDGSTDDSKSVVESMADRFPVPVRVDWKPNGGLASARNRLVEVATGERVWFLDDDMSVPRSAIESHLGAGDQPGPVVWFGPSHVKGNEGLRLFYEDRWRQLAVQDVVSDPGMVSFANTSADRRLLAEHRFDERFRGYGFEDYELALRMMEVGVRFRFLGDSGVTHHNDKSGFEMLHNIREEGVNRVQLVEIHPDSGRFALELRPGRLARLARPVAERGWSRPLWWAAHVVRAAAMPVRGFKQYRIIRIADDLALYSGLALAWRNSDVGIGTERAR